MRKPVTAILPRQDALWTGERVKHGRAPAAERFVAGTGVHAGQFCAEVPDVSRSMAGVVNASCGVAVGVSFGQGCWPVRIGRPMASVFKRFVLYCLAASERTEHDPPGEAATKVKAAVLARG
jgi:hypothetical protein